MVSVAYVSRVSVSSLFDCSGGVMIFAHQPLQTLLYGLKRENNHNKLRLSSAQLASPAVKS